MFTVPRGVQPGLQLTPLTLDTDCSIASGKSLGSIRSRTLSNQNSFFSVTALPNRCLSGHKQVWAYFVFCLFFCFCFFCTNHTALGIHLVVNDKECKLFHKIFHLSIIMLYNCELEKYVLLSSNLKGLQSFMFCDRRKSNQMLWLCFQNEEREKREIHLLNITLEICKSFIILFLSLFYVIRST